MVVVWQIVMNTCQKF